TLGLATGGTANPVYEKLVRAHLAGDISFKGVRTFNLDEYVALPIEHPLSYHTYMAEHLFEPCDFQPDNTHIPNGNAPDLAKEANQYESAISDCGGVDFQFLGIGENGHIGFNEPTSSLASLTRVKTLAPSTVEANSRYFDSAADVPRLCITMGIGTILRADKIALLAVGERKSAAVRKMIEGPVAAMCPASALQLHRNTDIYLDSEAACRLELLGYYKSIHPCAGTPTGHDA
ncbi:UNVERIFIED_CONTAM: hypothetical protein GTU68_051321, partial [Idotea baltica]|nr:hypothetical protein [Idotea baltica]